MGNPNGCRVVLLLVPPLFLFLPTAVLTFLLERISSSILLSQALRNWRYGDYEITVYGPTTTGSNDFTNTDIALRIKQAPTFAILCVCVLAYIIGTLSICGIWELKRVEGTARHQRIWSWATLVSNLIMIGASVGIFGYTTLIQGREKGWHSYEDVGKSDQAFTRETWACQIDQFYPNQSWARVACGTAKAARFLLIAMAVASLLVVCSLWTLIHVRGGFKWLFGGKGRYGGFESIYEMQPTGPPVPFVVQPVQRWTPQSVQQWPAQPTQQWIPHPVFQAHKTAATDNERIVFR
ncbi:hypothetical protein BKA66DRAFT_462850 [Pyrenochaeta sp. MPI-SDFR-AT-0127]|nr:hypothetical protein BKA66DRAFT_462850 [Pyrenochaeta sp. MPI-SDFR-AT-0127]